MTSYPLRTTWVGLSPGSVNLQLCYMRVDLDQSWYMYTELGKLSCLLSRGQSV